MIDEAFIPGKPIPVAAGVRRVLARNPGMMTGAGTNTYLLGHREVAVLDPGPDDPHHLRSILAAGGPSIRWIIVTHTHRDHSPLAAALARATGARLIGLPPPAASHQDESFRPDESPRDGERLMLGEISLTAVHTPGHASNCVCYLLPAQRLLFTGDHVLAGVSPVIAAPDGEMAAYLSSLDKLLAYDFDRIAPGHGEVLTEGKRVVEKLRAHRIAREDKVLHCLEQPATLDSLTAAVYTDVAVDRHEWAKLTLQAHLIKLLHEGRVSEHDGVWRRRR
ncbi:MAG TPA: MBL fold metallo-hydrolase [Steroidobacteraceae bacterium]|nr:MBL fold metallo-hydrolase [Steroidobacteraceae bacterium]